MSMPAGLSSSEDRELLLELLNLASTKRSEEQHRNGVAILKRLPAEVVWDVLLQLHRSVQQAVPRNGLVVDQGQITEQLAEGADALDAFGNADEHVCGPTAVKANTAEEQQGAASGRAATDSSMFSLAQIAKASNEALTPRLGDLKGVDQSPDRAPAEQQHFAVSHRVLAALQQRELAAAGTKTLGSMELLTGSVDVHKSTLDFCLVPGSHGEQQAACIAPQVPAGLRTASSCSTGILSSAQAAGSQQQHFLGTMHDLQSTEHGAELAATPASKPPGPQPPRASTASANELRQSAVDGLKSFQLVMRTEGEWEDTASGSAYSAVPTPAASTASSSHTPSAAMSSAARLGSALHSPASSCHTPASIAGGRAVSGLPSFSSTGSSSGRTPGPAPQAHKQKQQKPSGIGLGRAMSALRRSITGRKQLNQEQSAAAAAGTQVSTVPVAATSTKSGVVPSSTSRAAAAAASSRAASTPTSLVQGRLGSFTETERVRTATAAGGSGSTGRMPAGAGTPGSSSSSSRGNAPATSSGYRPPFSSSKGTGNIAPTAAAANKSPLSKAPATPAAPAGRSVSGSPAPSTFAAAAAAALLSRTPSTGASVPRTPAAAQSPFSAAAEQRTPVAARPASAGLAWLKQQSEPHSAPVSPCPSRPESVASQYSVASTSKLGATRMAAATGQLPGFAMTKQMVAGRHPAPAKQQQVQRTPGSAARPSVALATSGSKGGYMPQGSSPAHALAAAAAAAASRAGVSRLPRAIGAPASAAQGSSKPGTALRSAAGAASVHQRDLGSASAGVAGRQPVSRCDALVGLQCASTAAAAATRSAGRRAAGGSELRRSRSHGSLAELVQDEQREVSEVRKMWQQRAAQHKQHQQDAHQAFQGHPGTAKDRLALRPHVQQQEPSSSCSSAAAAAAGQAGMVNRPISSTGLSRIPSHGSRLPPAPGVPPAAEARAQLRVLQGPEACESPPTSPVGATRHCSRGSRATGISDGSDAGFPAAAKAARGGTGAAIDASFVQGKMMGGLISRLDEMMQQDLPAQVNSAPLAPPPAAVGADGISRQLFTE